MKELEQAIERYNDAWNRHDLDAICALHAPDFVFENHTAGERAEGEAARGLVVSEWTATATVYSGSANPRVLTDS